MSGAIALIVTMVIVVLGYRYYASRFDREVIQSDPRKATPARMFNDGVDFMPASGSVLFGYQFKSIAALGPITGPIIAAQWGWLPALLWIILGTFFIGWVQDYASTMLAVRTEGSTMAGMSYKFISPRARTILLSFLYFYLLLIMGAFGSVVAGALANPAVPIGFIILTLAGMLAGQMTYRWRRDMVQTTVVTVGVAIVGVWLGTMPFAQDIIKAINGAMGFAWTNPANNQVVNNVFYLTPYGPVTWGAWFWGVVAIFFCYLGSVLPIWRFAQPVNYVSFWLVILGMLGSILGIFLAAVGIGPANASYSAMAPFVGFVVPGPLAAGVPSPLWPLLFVVIACGAVSGWHSLVSTSGTARQLEKETDALPVGGGAMYTEAVLAALSLTFAATSTNMYVAQGGTSALLVAPAAGVFSDGMGRFMQVFGIPLTLGTAFGNIFIAIMGLTVMQLVLRFMRVASAELLGDRMPAFRNPHIGSMVGIAFTFLILWTSFWSRIWILFGGANQLFAGLALMLISIWLIRSGKPYNWALWPAIFMYVTTVAALLYTGWASLDAALRGTGGAPFVFGNAVAGAIALFLVAAALMLAWDGYRSIRSSLSGAVPVAGK